MDKTTSTLINLVKKEGASSVAALLGHPSSQRVERWTRDQRIPENQKGTVNQMLILKGKLKGQKK